MDEPVEILLVEDNPNDVELTLHAWLMGKSSALGVNYGVWTFQS